jgi:HlyD family secretion protein
VKLRVLAPVLLLSALGVGVWQLVEWRRQPPEVAFARAVKETITSSVPTNGKVEPVEWAIARAERSGPVAQILVERGQRVMRGQALVELDASEATADLAAAEARITQARAELDVLAKGGRATELAGIASELERARLDLTNAQREHDTLARLEARQAATRAEVEAAKELVDKVQLQIGALDRRRVALVAVSDRTAAEARLHDGEAAAQLAQARIRMSVVRAPLDGVVYQFDLKRGAYLNAGDGVASVGRLDRVHVNVYVDEPDLGRVARGMPVVITWDALPGRKWTGAVDKMPAQITALGARQVGEVVCVIGNPDLDLLPGTNVNSEIRSESVADAVTIPKESIRRELGQDGVFVLEGDRLAWRTLTVGVNNTTRIQVRELKEGDAVALPSEKPLKDKMIVRAVFP